MQNLGEAGWSEHAGEISRLQGGSTPGPLDRSRAGWMDGLCWSRNLNWNFPTAFTIPLVKFQI